MAEVGEICASRPLQSKRAYVVARQNSFGIWPIAKTIGEVNPENGLTLGLA